MNSDGFCIDTMVPWSPVQLCAQQLQRCRPLRDALTAADRRVHRDHLGSSGAFHVGNGWEWMGGLLPKIPDLKHQ